MIKIFISLIIFDTPLWKKGVNCQVEIISAIYFLLQCVSQYFWPTVSEVRMKSRSFHQLMAILLHSCQSNLEIWTQVVNFTPNFVGKLPSSLRGKFMLFGNTLIFSLTGGPFELLIENCVMKLPSLWWTSGISNKLQKPSVKSFVKI